MNREVKKKLEEMLKVQISMTQKCVCKFCSAFLVVVYPVAVSKESFL